MPARKDIHSILIIGSGPIVVGQACEFDYSGNQAVRALKEEGYHIIVHNPNPATVMTIRGVANRVSYDPLELGYAEDIIRQTRPDAILTTMGGQTALNLVLDLEREGVLARYEVELIGARAEQIRKAEDRGIFKDLMKEIGLECPFSTQVATLDEGLAVAEDIGYPVIVRPSFTLGGRGGGIARTKKALQTLLARALDSSPVHSALVEESLLRYQEFEFELMRDKASNSLVVCSIENIDPMGVHTGDSITVAPIQTLSDVEYQSMRSASLAVMEAIGIDCGGANVQFAYDPRTKRQLVIEMNPRVSRSSALASKATGFPIARCSAKLAVGCTLDEILNEITGKTKMFFEPSLDYCAVKIPRFEMDKFPIKSLGTQMHSVGETLAVGRSFLEALNKAVLSSESGFLGLEALEGYGHKELEAIMKTLHPLRTLAIVSYFVLLIKKRLETTQRATQRTRQLTSQDIQAQLDINQFFSEIEGIAAKTAFSTWVVYHLCQYAVLLCELEYLAEQDVLALYENTARSIQTISGSIEDTFDQLKRIKEAGVSDELMAKLSGIDQDLLTRARRACGLIAGLASIDTCAAEFEAQTPYLYSSYRASNELAPVFAAQDEKNDMSVAQEAPVIILGSGPNRIGQGLEFDTCCTMAIQAFKKRGRKVIIINNNPETVSTDYNVSDRLYLEPLHPEYIDTILAFEQGTPPQNSTDSTKPENQIKIVAQLGGQTSLNLARKLVTQGAQLLGTDFASINAAEDRGQFSEIVTSLGLSQPKHRIALNVDQIIPLAQEVGFPVLVRPSFVIGGQAMEIVYSVHEIKTFIARHRDLLSSDPILIDEFLEEAEEFDIDAVADGDSVFIGAVLRHIEHAGVHSGDSASVYTPFILTHALMQNLYQAVYDICCKTEVRGCVNVQCAIKNDTIYILEVNPRASRTMPLVSKTSKVDLIDLAVGVWLGESLVDQDCFERYRLKNNPHIAVAHSEMGWVVKESVFSFDRFDGADPRLSPQMQSTGEVLGLGTQYGEAFAKASIAAHTLLPTEGLIFVSISPRVRNSHCYYLLGELYKLGFRYCAKAGMAKLMRAHGIDCDLVESDPIQKDITQKDPTQGATAQKNSTQGDPAQTATAQKNISSILPDGLHTLIAEGKIALMINVPDHRKITGRNEDKILRNLAVRHRIPYVTTIPGLKGAVEGMAYLQTHEDRSTIIDLS